MKKLLLTFITLLFLFSFTPSSIAEQSKQDEPWSWIDSFYWYQVPVVCGPEHEVRKHLHDMGFTPQEWSLGRSDGKRHGEPVYMIVTYYNEDKTVKTSMIKLPGNPNVCLMYLTFDVVDEKPKELPK